MFTEKYGYFTKHDVQTKEQFAEEATIGEWERFKTALADFRKVFKAVARVNVQACCRGCAEIKTRDEEQTVIWHYGGQGNRITEADVIGTMYFNHENFTQRHYEWLRARLNIEGIDVVWDGTQSQCLQIVFDNVELNVAYGMNTIVAKRKVNMQLEQEKKAQEMFKQIAEAWNFESAWV